MASGCWSTAVACRDRSSLTAVSDRAGAAQLRWFIVSEALQGRDFGQRLMSVAMDFCRSRFATVYLHTFAGLDAARHLYERHGFKLISERPSTEWGPPVLDQHFEWNR